MIETWFLEALTQKFKKMIFQTTILQLFA